MKYLSVCSGIEAASVAWYPLGWKAFGYSEVDTFPSAVLKHHYPDTPNFGDMTKFKEWPDAAIDLLVGGTPCQSFSVAGLRKGLADPRGNLMLTYLAIADQYRPRWLVWENVPGVLSSGGGRDFGTLLGGLGQLGYGFAYRVLDAQYFGVAQRRRRVFVVGHLGDWRRAAAVLFERHSLQGHPAPRRKAGEVPAKCLTRGAASRFDSETETMIPVAYSWDEECNGRVDLACSILRGGDGGRHEGVAYEQPFTLAVRGRGESHDLEFRQDGTANALLTPNGGRCGMGVGAIAFDCKASGQNGFGVGEIASTMRAMGHAGSHCNGGGHQAVVFVQNQPAFGFPGNWINRQPQNGSNQVQPNEDHAPCLTKTDQHGVMTPTMQVRRLTPRECERLQGFEDDYTLINVRGKPAADGPRYKALGNSMAVPVMRWIGQRIDMVEAIK